MNVTEMIYHALDKSAETYAQWLARIGIRDFAKKILILKTKN